MCKCMCMPKSIPYVRVRRGRYLVQVRVPDADVGMFYNFKPGYWDN